LHVTTSMSRPRCVLPGKTYLVTRRCTQRTLLLLPSRTINEVFLYCLAYAAWKFSVRVHAFSVLSNHFHLVVTDPRAKLPAFMEWLNGTVARCLNAHYGRWENFWAPGTYSRIELTTDDTVLEEMVYTLTKPVEAGLVAFGAQWPGLRSRTLRQGAWRIVARRPRIFFRENGGLPEEVELVVGRPPAYVGLDDSEFGEILDQAVRSKERDLRGRMKVSGRRFLGKKGVLKQSSFDAPMSQEPRRQLNPQVAGRDKWKRVETLQALRQFLTEYAEALGKFCAGVRNVIFPAGTYWMRVHYRVHCHAPP